MAETTAASVFSSGGGGGGLASFGPGGGGGPLFEKINQTLPFSPEQEKMRLEEDPFRKAAKEQQDKIDAAFEEAKKTQVTTSESGLSEKTGTTSGTQQTTFDSRGKTEQELLDASIANYGKQQDLVALQEEGITARSGVQESARGSLQSIMGGQAFELSPGEQARIDRLRQAGIDVGSNAVNAMLTERLGEVSADAARRGLRGQAFTQLQGDALGEAAKSLERQTLEANRIAAEQAISMPGQRVGIQAGTAGQFADFSDQLQQQAIQNRQSLQDPIALQQLRDERLKGGKTTTSGTTSDKTTSSGTSVQTGAGANEILAAGAMQPTQTGAQVAGVLGLGQVVGEIIPG